MGSDREALDQLKNCQLFANQWDISAARDDIEELFINHFRYHIVLKFLIGSHYQYLLWCRDNCTNRFHRFLSRIDPEREDGATKSAMAFESADDAMLFKLVFS
jgi:hypothetical protein